MFSINKSCGCKGSQRCHLCRRSSDHPKIYTDENEHHRNSRKLFKQDETEPDHRNEYNDTDICKFCEKINCICEYHDEYESSSYQAEEKVCKCKKGKKHSYKCKHCSKNPCDCKERHSSKYYGYDFLIEECDACEVTNEDCEICDLSSDDCEICEIMKCDCEDHHHHKPCHFVNKGMDLCRKKEKTRCFKHCGPISQPCDGNFYNHFTSRANLDFSGLIVVKNTGNLTCGCSMEIRITDSAGTSTVAIVNPGASVPIFVDCLITIDIACFRNDPESTKIETCSGEVIFDLEY